MVGRCGRWPRRRRAARRVPGVLPRTLRALGRPVRLPGGGPAVAPPGVPPAGGERRGTHRAGVRTRPRAHRPARRVARGGTDAQVRRRVQGAAKGAGAHHPGRAPADPGLHGPLRGRGGAPRHLRPRRGAAVGGQGISPRGAYGRGHGDRVGNVNGARPRPVSFESCGTGVSRIAPSSREIRQRNNPVSIHRNFDV